MTHLKARQAEARWSSGGIAMMFAIAVQLPFDLAAMDGRFAALGTRLLLIVAALTLGSIIVTVRCRIPDWAKSASVVLLLAGLLAVTMGQDPFGLKGVDHAIDNALVNKGQLTPAETVRVLETETVSSVAADIRPKPDQEDNGFSALVARRLAEAMSDPRYAGLVITGTTEFRPGRGNDAYGMTWAITRDGDSAWCGKTMVLTNERETAAAQVERVVRDAMEASRDGRPKCSARA